MGKGNEQLRKLAEGQWKTFEKNQIGQVYEKFLTGKSVEEIGENCRFLEFSHYFEEVLWPNFHEKNTDMAHLMSIVLLLNEKAKAGLNDWWQEFSSSGEDEKKNNKIASFVEQFLTYQPTSILEQIAQIQFLIQLYQNLEQPFVSKYFLRLTSLPLWKKISPSNRQQLFVKYPKIKRHWQNLIASEEADSTTKVVATAKNNRKRAKIVSNNSVLVGQESEFFPRLIDDFLVKVLSLNKNTEDRALEIVYTCRFMELLIDLISQLPTRRFLRVLLMEKQVLVLCRQCLNNNSTNKEVLFQEQTALLSYYMHFEIEDQTGLSLSKTQQEEKQAELIESMQKKLFQTFFATNKQSVLEEITLSCVGELSDKEKLTSFLNKLTLDQLIEVAETLGLPLENELSKFIDMVCAGDDDAKKKLIVEMLVESYGKHPSQVDLVKKLPLFPTEKTLWDPNRLRAFSVDRSDRDWLNSLPLSVPKLNLQFLDVCDYLMRIFRLYRLESAEEIRADLEKNIKKLTPRLRYDNELQTMVTVFRNNMQQERMMTPIDQVELLRVSEAKLGETKPEHVEMMVTYHRSNQNREWDELKRHESVFLVSIQASIQEDHEMLYGSSKHQQMKENDSLIFAEKYGVVSVRGGEILEQCDDSGTVISEYYSASQEATGEKRQLKLRLDSAQYQQDLFEKKQPHFNLLIRRKQKENNFKAILACIVSLLNEKTKKILPDWLHETILGYNHSSTSSRTSKEMDFVDSFQDDQHLMECFPQRKVVFENNESVVEEKGSFVKLTFNGEEELRVQKYVKQQPLYQMIPPNIRFTPVQMSAIVGSLTGGLQVIVGPPGTGKTDVAVQTVTNLYKTFPSHRIVIVTHANAALNDICQKILHRQQIAPQHVLRLGANFSTTQNNMHEDFSKKGRVQYVLQRRLDLLQQVQQMVSHLIDGELEGKEGFSSSCENAAYFFDYHVKPSLDMFKEKRAGGDLRKIFPFAYLLPTEIDDRSLCKECDAVISHVENVFKELEEYSSFELLRTMKQRSDYLLIKSARVVLMTCTHAALIHSSLVEMGFRYHSVVMEEAAQITEVETLIPMCLQQDKNMLERVVLIGDHRQLGPIVKSQSLKSYARIDQSLFTRLCRLNYPSLVQLTHQARSRPSIAQLYKWRYKNLEDLHPSTLQLANPAFLHTYQFIHVDGEEFSPQPFSYENHQEAEYLCRLYQYMLAHGYPSSKITILTTYNGQKHFLRQAFRHRFNSKVKISTVDRYQGQQNDFILVSLVRTKSVGHLRDIRRLIVAMSRAKLGLYVVGCDPLFRSCFELAPVWHFFNQKPKQLHLVPDESYEGSKTRKENQKPPSNKLTVIKDLQQFQQFSS